MTEREKQGVSRRWILKGIGAGLASVPAVGSLACSNDDPEAGESTGDVGTSSGTDDTETNAGADSTGSGDCQAAASWASGGTAAMTGLDCYPDPFSDAATNCILLCETTEGPCTADTIERQDVSEGFGGLPVRLALKFVEQDGCEAVVGAVVEIWHTQRTGVYSGVTPSGAFCYGDDPSAEDHLYFRGSQTTDASGRVDFDTCFPGWYSGRALHIHFRVYREGEVSTTSQLFFSETLTEELFSSHPDYAEFGQPDTLNSNDNVVGGEEDLSPYVLDTQRMSDGAMLAWKLIAIRSSSDAESCTVGGAMGGGPPGGPPGAPP
ncbi:MAG: protocatechuate 3,4-dioxygenase [Nannocystaceae bacterium]|nr:protocatechuate 3,4-dioxygenase [Nannocystaceae bacterium]